MSHIEKETGQQEVVREVEGKTTPLVKSVIYQEKSRSRDLYPKLFLIILLQVDYIIFFSRISLSLLELIKFTA